MAEGAGCRVCTCTPSFKLYSCIHKFFGENKFENQARFDWYSFQVKLSSLHKWRRNARFVIQNSNKVFTATWWENLFKENWIEHKPKVCITNDTLKSWSRSWKSKVQYIFHTIQMWDKFSKYNSSQGMSNSKKPF